MRVRVCVCIKMATRRPPGRWRKQQFRGDSRESCAFSADGNYEAHAEPAIQLPIGDGCRFCRGSDPNTIKTSNSFASLDLHSSAPPYHYTPWGPSSWQSDRPTLTVSSGSVVGRPGAPRRPVLRPWRPAAAHPRVFRRGPGQPILMTVFGLRNRTQAIAWILPYALYGQGDRRRCVCAYLCVCVCTSIVTQVYTRFTKSEADHLHMS